MQRVCQPVPCLPGLCSILDEQALLVAHDGLQGRLHPQLVRRRLLRRRASGSNRSHAQSPSAGLASAHPGDWRESRGPDFGEGASLSLPSIFRRLKSARPGPTNPNAVTASDSPEGALQWTSATDPSSGPRSSARDSPGPGLSAPGAGERFRRSESPQMALEGRTKHGSEV